MNKIVPIADGICRSKNCLGSLVEVLSRYNQTSLTPRLLCMTHGRDNSDRRILAKIIRFLL